MKNRKIFLYTFGVIVALILLFYFIGQVILPFIVGLIGAFLVNPIVKRIQKTIPGRKFAVTTFITLSIAVFIGIIVLFGAEIVNDVKRLNQAFQTFAQEHHDEIDETNQKVRSYIQHIYNSEEVQDNMNQIDLESDSLKTSAMDELQSALKGITSFLGSSDNTPTDETDSNYGLNWVAIFFGSIIYFFYILYSFDYFENKYHKYFSADLKKNHFVKNFVDDFKRIFLDYFRKRSKIVFICFLIFLTSFLIMDLPGAILISCLAALLCYIPHFQYIAILPMLLGCWVLSMETGINYFIFLGICLAVFIVISILEETIFTPKIMKDYNGMNPAIMIVSFTVWTYLFGVVFGTLIALPLTAVVLIYLDQLLLHTKKVLTESDDKTLSE